MVLALTTRRVVMVFQDTEIRLNSVLVGAFLNYVHGKMLKSELFESLYEIVPKSTLS